MHSNFCSYMVATFLLVCSCLETGCAQDGEGAYGGNIYYYYTPENLTFDDAQTHCQSYTNGGLAELSTEDIKTFVNSLITGNHRMWIGSKKLSNTFTWIYSLTDTPDSSVKGAGNGKDCVYYRNSGEWKAARCTDKYGAICARPGNVTSSAPGTDVTGISRLVRYLHRMRRNPENMVKGQLKRSTTVPTFLESTTKLTGISTPCSGQCENPQVPATTDRPSDVSPRSTSVPVVTDPPPEVEGNVSHVVDLTLDTSYFKSPVFVTGLEKWLASNDEIPDDLNEEQKLEYAKEFFDVCNNVFEVDLLALGETDAASIFADACSHLAQDLTSDLNIGESVNISTAHVDVYASVQKGSNFTGYVQVIEDNDDVNDSDDESDAVQVVIIPPDGVSGLHLSEEDTIGVSVVVYKRGHFIVDHHNQSTDTSHRPAGPVVSITVAVNDNVTSVPVEFILENDISHLLPADQSDYELGNVSCNFWDSTVEGEGEWNDYGCEVVNATRGFTQCACNHTTHFGVLLQVWPVETPAKDELALNLITYIGSGISIACLLLTILILNMLTSLTSDRVKIHKNLVTALTIAQGLFLSLDAASRHKISCKAIAICLHYFYLSVFCWSLLEGVNLYIQIVQVFSTGKSLKYRHYLLLGWGTPIPIVVISAWTKWKIYGVEGQCWLTIEDGLIWSFAAPVIVVISVNLIVLIMVVRVIVKSASAHKKDNYDHIKAGVKGALILVPILGLGWVFGFLSLGRATLVFTYLFVVIVALQGVLIFLLYCAFNSEVRAALRRKDEKRKLRRGDGLSSVPTPSSGNSTQSNDTSTTFASKLIDKIKRRRSSTTAARNTPIDRIELVDRSDSPYSTREVILHSRKTGSIDSGYSQNLVHTPNYIPADSTVSIRTEVAADEFIPPNTPTYDHSTMRIK
ncbi:adhesion G protein-coupled receptor L3-like isoform X3 [Lytechinus variegatus]|uniref:adhesion G protein-coupled receptor L3-like isoform X3 n=1 Tax=Lytechinus variegatus TaxID=7654 RepID=UPI001BB18A28|nr:adhesion G protein-coupled receptor L3-like isoform X3 [Lytechinus variegatus]